MSFDSITLVLAPLLVIGTVWAIVGDYLAQLRRERSVAAPSTGEICIACNAIDVTLIAPMVYRCNVCGHEGGDGWASGKRARRDASFLAWSSTRRRRSAKRDLLEARTLLLAGLGDLERSRHEPADTAERTKVSERDASVACGTGRLLEAQGKLCDAQVKLDVTLDDAAEARLEALATPEQLLVAGTALLRAVDAALESLRARSRSRARRAHASASASSSPKRAR